MNYKNKVITTLLPNSRFLIFTILILASMPSRADLALEYAVTLDTFDSKLHRVNGKDVRTPQNKTEQYKETVLISDRKYAVSSGDSTVVYDHARKVIIHFNNKNRTWYQRSLYTVIGFRRMEFANRQFLGNVLSEAGVDGNPMGRLPTEHLFAMQDKKQPLTLQPVKEGNWIRYGNDKMPLMRVLAGKKMNKKDTAVFLEFMRYKLGGHPIILEDLQNRRRVPEQFEFYRYNLNKQVFRYKLVNSSKRKATFPDKSGFREIAGDGELHPIEKLVFETRKHRQPVGKHASKLLEAAAKDYDQDHFLDAMLSYLEYTLQTGADMPADFQPRKKKITADKNVKLLLQYLSPKDKAGAENAVKVLARLKKNSLHRKHVLGIFEGNIYGSLGQSDKERELLMQALDKNRLLTGVYKDLGDNFYGAYEADLAWLCWDFARELARDHRLLKQVSTYEVNLQKHFPEFFL